jgi:hypothetical protein
MRAQRHRWLLAQRLQDLSKQRLPDQRKTAGVFREWTSLFRSAVQVHRIAKNALK